MVDVKVMKPLERLILILLHFTWMYRIQLVSAIKVPYNVQCNPDSMEISFEKAQKDSIHIYLDKYKNIKACQPKLDENNLVFKLAYNDQFLCGLTKVVSQLTSDIVYYHRIILEQTDSLKKETVFVKCNVKTPKDKTNIESRNGESQEGVGNFRSRRQIEDISELPPGFIEPEEIELTGNITGEAPVPILSVSIKQNGSVIGNDLSVKPGAPLEMEVFLDSVSAGTYGLEVSRLDVTDARSKQEVLVLNSCSVDTHLFENFVTADGDYLKSRFKAFKFPETTYVEFRGVVDVCLDKCKGETCSNNEIGFGRRRRSITSATHSNHVFQVTMSTVIKVDFSDGIQLERGVLAGTYTPEDKPQSANLQLEKQDIIPDSEYALEEISHTESKVESSTLHQHQRSTSLATTIFADNLVFFITLFTSFSFYLYL